MESQVSFFKLYSNLGIFNIPNHQKERNDGVYFGPDAVLNSKFISNFHNSKTFEYRFTKNSDVNKDNIFELFAKDIINCAKEISSKINSNEVLVAVGGDNIVFLAVFVADQIRFKDRSIGIIDFDTHGDIHLRGTSPTGNIHGMYLRPIFDKFDLECVDKVVPNKLSGRDLMYFGNFDFEKEERDFLDHQKIPQFTKQDLELEIDHVKSSLNNFLSSHDHILINFDIDVLDKTLAPATGIPTENGLIFSEIEEILSLIKNHKSKTIVLSEINPEKDGIDATVLSAERVISAML